MNIKKVFTLSFIVFTLMPSMEFCDASNEPCVELLLIDSNGKRVGYDSNTGTTLEEIQNSSYGEECFEDIPVHKVLDIITPPRSDYILYVIGKDSGTYGLEIRPMDDDANSKPIVLEGTIARDEVKKMYIDYNPVAGSTTTVFEDNTPPQTQLTVSSGAYTVIGGTTYLTSASYLVLTSTDPVVNGYASGVKYTEYRIDSNSWTVYSSSIPLSGYAEGSHTIDYQSVDSAGNTENFHTLAFVIDDTPPVADTVRPVVVATYPLDNGWIRVNKDTVVKVTFSEPVRCANWYSSVMIEGFRSVDFKDHAEAFGPESRRLKGRVFRYDNSTCTLFVEHEFRKNGKYTITLTNTITDLAGNALDKYTLDFTTLPGGRDDGRCDNDGKEGQGHFEGH
jgi:hypothetical protein